MNENETVTLREHLPSYASNYLPRFARQSLPSASCVSCTECGDKEFLPFHFGQRISVYSNGFHKSTRFAMAQRTAHTKGTQLPLLSLFFHTAATYLSGCSSWNRRATRHATEYRQFMSRNILCCTPQTIEPPVSKQ